MADLKEVGLALLDIQLNVDMNAVAVTNLFTVPEGKTCIPVLVAVLADGVMSSASFGFGFDAGGVNCLASAVHADLDGATKFAALLMQDAGVRGIAGDVFKCGVTVAHGGAVTADVYIFGFLL